MRRSRCTAEYFLLQTSPVGVRMIIAGKKEENYRSWLTREWDKRRAANPRYSLRAFSNFLSVGSTTLSDVLAGKRSLSKQSAQRIAEKLQLSAQDTEEFLLNVQAVAEAPRAPLPVTEIEAEIFKSIADWYHYGILGLASLPKCPNNAIWISEKLQIKVREAEDAIARLQKLNFIRITDENHLENVANGMISTTKGVPSLAVRQHHSQILKLAQRSLDNDPVTIRDFSAITIPANAEQIEEVRKLAKEFRRGCKALLQHGKLNRIYSIAVQVFPVSQSMATERELDEN